MSTSSRLEDYSITLNDTVSIDLDTISMSGTYTIDPGYSYNHGTTITSGAVGSTYTISSISGISASPVNTISSINISDFKINLPEEWVNCFPDFDRIEKMCKEYPGLKIAYDQFKTVYALVRDDYDTPKDQRVKP